MQVLPIWLSCIHAGTLPALLFRFSRNRKWEHLAISGIRVLEPVLLPRCLDTLRKLLENCAISQEQGCIQSQIQAQRGLRSCKFQGLFTRDDKTQLARYIIRMLLEVEQQDMGYSKQVRDLIGRGQDGSGFHIM
uniref:Uncharacterized protein n=1 Tax=Spironucleus salmonicida TaxID=348837 RepID=V6LXI8_9EUKA|eukprot:EST45534.1 Hypothetical protein SS50377_14536 [Spironucleus salmonicida]